VRTETRERPSPTIEPPTRGRRWRVERRAEPQSLAWYRSGAMVIGLLIAVLIAPMLTDQGTGIYRQLWTATLGSTIGLENVLALATPLVLTGLAAAIPYRVGLWNIGGDGQMFVGAWLAALAAFSLSHLSGALLIPLMFVAAAVGGAAWALLPALARVFLGVNEIITTLLCNFIAVLWMTYWAAGRWADPLSGGGVRSKSIPAQSELQGLRLGTLTVPTGFLLAAALALAVWVIFRYTTLGYASRVVGKGFRASVYAGIPARRLLVVLMLSGGALGGLAGGVEMMGDIHRYSAALTTNTGYSGIVVAVIAVGSALGVLCIGVVFAGMLVGGQALQVAGVSSSATLALVGLILLLAALGDAFARVRLVAGDASPPGADIA
jgi:general nucleoside transport system permease protein